MSDPEPAPASPSPLSRRRRRLGLRSEILILLPVATLVLVALSVFTLFSFRNALYQVAEERRAEAARIARDFANQAARLARLTSEDLHRLVPFARGAGIANSQGVPLATIGDLAGPGFLAPLNGRPLTSVVAVGPSDDLPGVIAGYAPFGLPPDTRILRIDFSAAALDAQQRGVAVLLVVVATLDTAVVLLLVAFLRYALRPYDALLAQARAVGSDGETDEAEFLITTFERALKALARQGTAGAGDDIAALEQALAPSLESGLLMLDRKGEVLALNPVGERLLGVSAATVGQPLERALRAHPKLVELLLEAIRTCRAVQRAEIPITPPAPVNSKAPSQEGILGLTVHPLRRDDGGVRGFLVLFADLTEIRRREEESRLAESLERIGELAAGVAHELRNSLATLRGYLTLIGRRPGEEAVEDYLGEIRRETDHLQRVLEDFLAFARPGSTRLEDVDLQTIVRRAAADPALGGAPVVLHFEVAEGTLMRGDSQLLERAVRNLLHNAVQASEAAGAETAREPIEAIIRSIPDGLQLEVADRGTGLPPEVREHLFLPFVSARPGGVGLGLALTHRIVTLHGGRTTLEARAGGGTVARIDFPIHPPSAGPDVPRQ